MQGVKGEQVRQCEPDQGATIDRIALRAADPSAELLWWTLDRGDGTWTKSPVTESSMAALLELSPAFLAAYR